MTHRRIEVRDKALALLDVALAATPVIVCRDYAAQPIDQPSVAVSTPTETVLETLQLDPPTRRFGIELVIDVVVAGQASAQTTANQLDEVCTLIENALDGTLAGVAETCQLQSTATAGLSKGKQTLWAATLVFEVGYVQTTTPPLGITTTDLTSIHTDFDMANPSLPAGGPDGQIDAANTNTFT